MSDSQTPEDKRPTFDEVFERTYQRHEFAEIVRIGLAIGDWIAGLRQSRAVARPAKAEPRPDGRPAAPAT